MTLLELLPASTWPAARPSAWRGGRRLRDRYGDPLAAALAWQADGA